MTATLDRSTVADATRMYGRHPARPESGTGRAELIAECERQIVAMRNGERPGAGSLIALLAWTVDALWELPE